MAHHVETGRNLYLRTTEPVRFLNTLIKNAEASIGRGFNVKISMGGPEKFPAHVFENRDFGMAQKKLQIFVDSITYWTRMVVEVTGKSDAENEAEVDAVLRGLEGEVEPH